MYSIYNIKYLKLINKDNITINNNYFNNQIYSLIYLKKDSIILELGAGEGLCSCVISTFINNNLFCIEKNNTDKNILSKNKTFNNLNFNILNYDINYSIKNISNINLIIINKDNYLDYLINNLDYVIDNIDIILINSDLIQSYFDFVEIIKINNFILINTNYYNVFIKDKEKIINFNNSKCDYGYISINNFIGFVNNYTYNVHIKNDILFQNYNTIFAHSNCSIELNIIKPIKINAFINYDSRHMFNQLNNNIKFIINDVLIDNLNSYTNVTKECILKEGVYNIKLIVDENPNNNACCHTGFY